MNPHSATDAQPLVATYEIPGLDDNAVKMLTLAIADRPGVVSAKADTEAGLFKVTYTSGCPHGMLNALQGVAKDAKLQGIAAGTGEPVKKPGCGGCPNKESCGGSH